MASKICRLSTKLHSLTHKLTNKPNTHIPSLPSHNIKPSPTLRTNQSFRVPVELSSCISLFPLHSAVASARLVSSLSVESKNWCLVPQGLSMPL